MKTNDAFVIKKVDTYRKKYLPLLLIGDESERMLNHIEFLHQNKTIILGTGETPSTLRFYKSCGFSPYRRIPDFFTVNYPRPIVEEGITLRDLIYLRKDNHIIGKNDID